VRGFDVNRDLIVRASLLRNVNQDARNVEESIESQVD